MPGVTKIIYLKSKFILYLWYIKINNTLFSFYQRLCAKTSPTQFIIEIAFFKQVDRYINILHNAKSPINYSIRNLLVCQNQIYIYIHLKCVGIYLI